MIEQEHASRNYTKGNAMQHQRRRQAPHKMPGTHAREKQSGQGEAQPDSRREPTHVDGILHGKRSSASQSSRENQQGRADNRIMQLPFASHTSSFLAYPSTFLVILLAYHDVP